MEARLDLIERTNMKTCCIFCALIFLLSNSQFTRSETNVAATQKAGATTQKVEIPESRKYSFEGVVEKAVSKHDYEGEALLVAVHPRVASFVIVVSDAKELSGEVPAAKEGRLTFAIHSIVQTFNSSDPVGKKFIFTVSISEKTGHAYFIEAKPATQEKK